LEGTSSILELLGTKHESAPLLHGGKACTSRTPKGAHKLQTIQRSDKVSGGGGSGSTGGEDLRLDSSLRQVRNCWVRKSSFDIPETRAPEAAGEKGVVILRKAARTSQSAKRTTTTRHSSPQLLKSGSKERGILNDSFDNLAIENDVVDKKTIAVKIGVDGRD
jgi:hypothetical protein